MLGSFLSHIKRKVPKSVKDRLRDYIPVEVWSSIRAYSYPLDLYRTDRFNFFPVCHNPPVIYTFSRNTIGNISVMSDNLDSKYAHFVYGFTRHISKKRAKFVSRQYMSFKKKYPKYEITFIANSSKEIERLKKNGLNCRLINKNSFQREDQFYIEKDEKNKYNSVINSRMVKWKRIELAKNIEKLVIVTVVEDKEYMNKIMSVMEEAEWSNFDKKDSYNYLGRGEIRKILNKSRTGLILSESEANNKASIEYLLCGVPVVSTPSVGGRDVFFDDRYCKIVNPDPEAVRNGVEELIARDVDPEYVRERTLEKIREHRARFLELVYDLSGGRFDASVDDWLELFPRNMKFQCDPEHFNAFLESDYLQGRPDFVDGNKLLPEKHLRERKPDRWRSIVGSASTSKNSDVEGARS